MSISKKSLSLEGVLHIVSHQIDEKGANFVNNQEKNSWPNYQGSNQEFFSVSKCKFEKIWRERKWVGDSSRRKEERGWSLTMFKMVDLENNLNSFITSRNTCNELNAQLEGHERLASQIPFQGWQWTGVRWVQDGLCSTHKCFKPLRHVTFHLTSFFIFNWPASYRSALHKFLSSFFS